MTQNSKSIAADARSAWSASATLHLAIPFVIALVFGWNRTFIGPETSLIISWTFWCGFVLMIWIGAALGSELVYRLLAPWRPPLWLITVLGPVVAAVLMLGIYAPMVEFGRSLGGGGLMSTTRVAPALSLSFAIQFLRDILPGTVLWVGVNYLFDRMVGMPRYRYPERPAAAPAPPPPEPLSPPILRRLPGALQGDLLFLQAEDHYVRVATTAGQALVHSRFTDAIAAAHPVEGVQVHRSFWVACTAIAELQKTGGAYSARLTDGTVLPVSRTYLTNIRAQTRSSRDVTDHFSAATPERRVIARPG